MEVSGHFTFQLLYPYGKSPHFSLARAWVVLQSHSRCGGEEKDFCLCWELSPDFPVLHSIALSLY
jgi:hypothetical protein